MRGIQHGPDLIDPIDYRKEIVRIVFFVGLLFAVVASAFAAEEMTKRVECPPEVSSGIHDGPDGFGGYGEKEGNVCLAAETPVLVLSTGSGAFTPHYGGFFPTSECTFFEAGRCQTECAAAAGPNNLWYTTCHISWRPANYVELNPPQIATRVCGCNIIEVDPGDVAR